MAILTLSASAFLACSSNSPNNNNEDEDAGLDAGGTDAALDGTVLAMDAGQDTGRGATDAANDTGPADTDAPNDAGTDATGDATEPTTDAGTDTGSTDAGTDTGSETVDAGTDTGTGATDAGADTGGMSEICTPVTGVTCTGDKSGFYRCNDAGTGSIDAAVNCVISSYDGGPSGISCVADISVGNPCEVTGCTASTGDDDWEVCPGLDYCVNFNNDPNNCGYCGNELAEGICGTGDNAGYDVCSFGACCTDSTGSNCAL